MLMHASITLMLMPLFSALAAFRYYSLLRIDAAFISSLRLPLLMLLMRFSRDFRAALHFDYFRFRYAARYAFRAD